MESKVMRKRTRTQIDSGVVGPNLACLSVWHKMLDLDCRADYAEQVAKTVTPIKWELRGPVWRDFLQWMIMKLSSL